MGPNTKAKIWQLILVLTPGTVAKMKKKTPDHKKLVAMENGLIPAFARIGKTEKRFLAYCIAQLNPVEETELGLIEFRVQDFAKIFDLALTHTYEAIRNVADTLNSRSFRRYENGVHKSDTWVWWSEYNEENGSIKIRLNERLTPLLLNLKEKQFIQFALKQAKDFTNAGWSLYVILKQWLKAGSQDFEIEELKALMDMTGKYKRWAEFSRQVIEPAIENINEVSDLRVSYEKIKRGRTVTGLSFIIKTAPIGDVIADQPSSKEELNVALIRAGMPPKTARDYTDLADKSGKIKWISDKLESLVQRSKGKENPKSYLQKMIKGEIDQGSLVDLVPLIGDRVVPEPEHKPALDCWHRHRQQKKKCPIRSGSKTPKEEKCRICLESLPIEQFG